MKLTLDKSLSLVALGVIGVLHSAQAAPVYEISNLADLMDESESAPKGTLPGTLYGYGMSLNDNGQMLGTSKGKRKLSSTDVENDRINIEDGLTEAEKITYSVNKPIVANNFTFNAAANAPEGAWLPTFESINGTTDPSDTSVVNSVDTIFYGINQAGVKVGVMTAPQKTLPYTGSNADQEFWYYRDYEERGFVKATDGTLVPIIPPYTQYIKGDNVAEIGGVSGTSAINASNLITGYAGTDIVQNSKDRIDNCFASDATLPVDICIQSDQFPDSNSYRYVQYQTRAFVWQLNEDNSVTPTQLPLGLTPDVGSTAIYTAQGLGVNLEGSVAGRSHVYRNGDTKNLRLDAGYWSKDAEGKYVFKAIPMTDDDQYSIAYDINDNGIIVGTYNRYIEGFRRDKFFYYDTKAADAKVITPDDFAVGLSDLTSVPTDINNKFQVVGYIETSYARDGLPRPQAGFLFDKNSEEFSNLNDLMTCEAKGFVKSGTDGDGYPTWSRKKVNVSDGSGKALSYNSDLLVVEAKSINEAGDITGTVFVRKPVYQKDSDGNLVLDSNNQPLFELNGNGEPVTAYTPRMVVMQSDGSTVTDEWKKQNNCVDKVEEVPYKRSGAGMFTWLFALPVLWLRRRKLNLS